MSLAFTSHNIFTMKHSYLIALLLALYVLPVSAKSVARNFGGCVVNASDSCVMEGVVCNVTAGTETIALAHTRPDGMFIVSVSDVEEGTPLTVTLSKEGFMNSEIVLPTTPLDVDLGYIWMYKGTTLDEVTVNAQQVLNRNGMSIVYPSSADVKASTTSLDLFQKLPLMGLDVNPITKTLSAKGGVPYILIDGVPSSMEDVRALQPKDILRVNFTRTPPIQYVSQGYTALLEITLKKRQDGGSVYASGEGIVTYNGHIDGNMGAEYHQGKSQFRLNYDGKYNRNTDVEDYSNRDYIGAPDKISMETLDTRKFWYFMNTLSARYNYRHSDKTIFSTTFRTNINDSERKASGVVKQHIGPDVQEYAEANDGSTKMRAYSLDLFLKQTLSPTSLIEAQVIGTYTDDRNDAYRKYFMTGEGLNPTVYDNSGSSNRKSLISELRWMKYINQTAAFTVNYKNTLSHAINKYASYTYDPTLNECLNNVSATWQHQINRVYYMLSSGINYNRMSVDNKSAGRYTNHYLSNNSTASIEWYMSPRWVLEGSCNFSSSLPSLTAITDYEYQINPFVWVNGNRELKPAHNLSGQLRLTNQGQHYVIAFSQGVSRDWNSQIGQYMYEADKNRFLLQTINMRKAISEQSALELSLRELYGFGFKGSLVARYGYYQGTNFTADKFSLGGSLYAWWNRGPFTASYYRNFPGKTIFGSNITTDQPFDKLSMSYQCGKHWTFSAGWSFMFSKNGWTNYTWDVSPVSPAYTRTYIRDDINAISIGFTYSGNFGSIFDIGSRSIDNKDDGTSLRKDSGN